MRHLGVRACRSPRVECRRMTVLVVMGVSGTGKSTVATALAEHFGWQLQEGDDLHPKANIAKMAGGQPLDDNDRWPWLQLIADWIGAHIDSGTSGIVTCSALKRTYRDVLRRDGVVFVYLEGSEELLRGRMESRTGHFMPASLLTSQLQTLEPTTVGRGSDHCRHRSDRGRVDRCDHRTAGTPDRGARRTIVTNDPVVVVRD